MPRENEAADVDAGAEASRAETAEGVRPAPVEEAVVRDQARGGVRDEAVDAAIDDVVDRDAAALDRRDGGETSA